MGRSGVHAYAWQSAQFLHVTLNAPCPLPASQSAILAVGGADKKVVRDAASGGYKEVSVMLVTLSCDHRVIDGAMGAEWLQAFKACIESPLLALL